MIERTVKTSDGLGGAMTVKSALNSFYFNLGIKYSNIPNYQLKTSKDFIYEGDISLIKKYEVYYMGRIIGRLEAKFYRNDKYDEPENK